MENAPTAPGMMLVETDDFTVGLVAKKATGQGHDVRLRPAERHLPEILITSSGRHVTQKELLQEVWG